MMRLHWGRSRQPTRKAVEPDASQPEAHWRDHVPLQGVADHPGISRQAICLQECGAVDALVRPAAAEFSLGEQSQPYSTVAQSLDRRDCPASALSGCLACHRSGSAATRQDQGLCSERPRRWTSLEPELPTAQARIRRRLFAHKRGPTIRLHGAGERLGA
jgi:hypothetical protein